MTNLIFLLVVLAAVTAAEGAYYFARYLGERPAEELRRRLQTVGNTGSGLQLLRRRRLGSSAWVNDLLADLPIAERLETLLEQADSASTVPGLLFKMLALAALGVAIGALLQRPSLALLLSVPLGAAPLLLILNARAARTRKIAEQLPEALDMMARAVRSGHAIPASLKLVARECAPPIAVEFAKAYEQQNLGLSLEAAVNSMTERVPGSLDLKLFAVSVNVQSETGGNLVEILEKISETMRERFKFYSKLSALTAEQRLSGYILASLPFIVAVLMWITNPEYLAELGHGIGRSILAVGVGLWLAGVITMRQLSKVTY